MSSDWGNNPSVSLDDEITLNDIDSLEYVPHSNIIHRSHPMPVLNLIA